MLHSGQVKELVSPADLLDAITSEKVFMTLRQAEVICDKIKEVLAKKGSYTLQQMHLKSGYVFTFYNDIDQVVDTMIAGHRIVQEAKDRKIPKLSWLRSLLALVRTTINESELKLVYDMIDNNIRDGGTWKAYCNNREVKIQLLFNERNILTMVFNDPLETPLWEVEILDVIDKHKWTE